MDGMRRCNIWTRQRRRTRMAMRDTIEFMEKFPRHPKRRLRGEGVWCSLIFALCLAQNWMDVQDVGMDGHEHRVAYDTTSKRIFAILGSEDSLLHNGPARRHLHVYRRRISSHHISQYDAPFSTGRISTQLPNTTYPSVLSTDQQSSTLERQIASIKLSSVSIKSSQVKSGQDATQSTNHTPRASVFTYYSHHVFSINTLAHVLNFVAAFVVFLLFLLLL